MAINPALLIAAPMLQDAILDDATGLPLVGGIISLYQDASRTTFKNWYYQTGAPGAYTYVALANPLTLNAAGVITDPNGNDTIPFFYPYSESDQSVAQPYYITVTDSAGHSKITRQNFPFNPTNQIVNTVNATLENLVVNNIFWRNNATGAANTINLTMSTSAVLAPSIHQGFVSNINVAASPVPITSSPDIAFFKSGTGSNDSITFLPFPAGTFLSSGNPQNLDVTPVYYMNFTAAAASSETFKIVQFPLTLNLQTMDSMPATLTFWARSNSGANTIVPQIYQYTGINGGNGAISPVRTGSTSAVTIPSNATWTKVSLVFTMPSLTGLSIGNAGDDAIFLQLSYPAGSGKNFSIDIAKPSLYVGNQSPTNDMQVNDIEEAIFNSPRTGDIRTSMNAYSPFGWVQMNDGTIGNKTSITSSNATTRANTDTWPLYSLVWSFRLPIFTSAGAPSSYGASAIADFNAFKVIQLPLTFGRGFMNLPASIACTYNRATTPSWNQGNYTGGASVAGLFTLSTGANTLLYPGAPVYLTGTVPTNGPFTANTVYYAVPDPTSALTSGTTFQLATTYANAIAVNPIAAGVASDNGSGLTINFALGQNFGEASHKQQIAELVAHNHTIGVINAIGAAVEGLTGGTTLSPFNSGTTGNSQYSNIVQPSTYMNYFMKL